YRMMNEKNHHIYTDKFVLSVVDLRHINLATEEDKEWKIDYWASLFKAATWEDLKMLAKQNNIIEEAVATMYEMTADETIREQCKAREKHEMELSTLKRMVDRQKQQLEQKNQQLEQKDQQLELMRQEIERLKAQQTITSPKDE
ncbi:MAG: PD-(D/E)XK nuclease family transposase, partial [Acetatifactor sp.]|nr:PD-(D/E)XK nuclease family transposase [Acetatifactor sp.]